MAVSRKPPAESRLGVALSSLDSPVVTGDAVTKRELVDYLDGVADRLVPRLTARALSVVRVRPGQQPFMQKNLPAHAPDWIPTLPVWSQGGNREIRYPLCNEPRTLLWFANQRAVEYHPFLFRGHDWDVPTELIIDLDPPEGAGFDRVVDAARAVREALAHSGLAGAVKTSGAKGAHVVVPLAEGTTAEEAAAATRALAARAERLAPQATTTAYLRADRGGKVFLDSTRSGGGTVVAAYSPRVRPGLPVSFPVAWDELEAIDPREVTVRTALEMLGGQDRWTQLLPAPQSLDAGLVAEGRTIPVARVAAMHEGKRRKRDHKA